MAKAQSQIVAQARLTAGTSTATIPKLVGRMNRDGGERVAAGRPCRLRVLRSRDGATGALDGTYAIYGKNLPHKDSKNSGNQRMVGADGATGRTVFTTALAFVTFANYNWIVLVNDVVIGNGAGAGLCQISDVGGVAVVTFGTALATTDVVQVTFGTVATLLADGANDIQADEIVGKDAYWGVGTHAAGNLSKTNAWVEPIV